MRELKPPSHPRDVKKAPPCSPAKGHSVKGARPTLDDIDAILKHLPVLERPGFVAMVFPKVDPSKASGLILTDEVRHLISDIYDHRFVVGFDWPAWQV